jgi:hypothetical protein
MPNVFSMNYPGKARHEYKTDIAVYCVFMCVCVCVCVCVYIYIYISYVRVLVHWSVG